MSKRPRGNVQRHAYEAEFTIRMHVAFTIIIRSFARLEHRIQITMAAIGKIDLDVAVLLTAGLGYQAKRDALFALLGTVNITQVQMDEIRTFLDEADKFNAIRNAIAHSLWVPGTRPGSVKPMGIRIRGKSKYLGVLDTEPDYTEDDLMGLLTSL